LTRSNRSTVDAQFKPPQSLAKQRKQRSVNLSRESFHDLSHAVVGFADVSVCTGGRECGDRQRRCAEFQHVAGRVHGSNDDVKSRRVEPVDGEEAFTRLRDKSQSRRSPG
jgi:hypothetical protein